MIITERYPAVVTDNQDPDQLGKIKVKCADIVGDEETELPMWVEPVMDWGWFYLPDVDEIVEVEVVTASDDDEQAFQSSLDSLDIKWRGKRFYGNEEGDAPTPINDEFKENYGKRRGIATPKGHVLIFDDTDGSEKIRLAWTDGTDVKYIEIDGDQVIVSHKDAQKVTLKDNNIELNQGDTQKVTMDGSTITLDHGPGNKIELGANSAKVTLGGETLNLSNAAAGVIAQLGGAAAIDAACKATPMSTLWSSQQGILQAHIHPSAAGPTGPSPAPFPAWVAAIVSPNMKIP